MEAQQADGGARLPEGEAPAAEAAARAGGEDDGSYTIVVPGGPKRIAAFIWAMCVIAVLICGYYTVVGRPERRTTTAMFKPAFPWSKPSSVQVEEVVFVRSPWALPAALIGALLVLRFWARPIERGKAWAVLLGYAVCALVVAWLAGFAAFAAVGGGEPTLAAILAWGVVAAGVALVTVRIVRSPNVWTWLKLNGKCPACHKWAFAAATPGMDISCAACGARLRFRSSRSIQVLCPRCGAKLQAPRSFRPGDVAVCPQCEAEFEPAADSEPRAT